MPGKQVAGMILCGLAVVLLLVGGLTKAWWSADKGGIEVGVGLTAQSVCQKDKCETHDYEKLVREDAKSEIKTWVTIGSITFFATFGVVAALLLTLGLGAAGKASGGPVSVASISTIMSGILLVAGIAFIATLPESMDKGLESLGGGMSYGSFAHLGGSIIGIVGSVMFMGSAQKAPPPNYASMSPQELATAPGPTCRACRKPTRWVAEYSKHYCDGCRLYI